MEYSSIKVGDVEIPGNVFLAPLAGITDQPYRRICRKLGASYAVAEMVASQKHLRESRKSQERFNLGEEGAPRAIQLLGSDPADLAGAARYAVRSGAQIVDFNCGCPAKKVCSVECGSALLKDEDLVRRLLESLTASADVPVTLKYRIGWDAEHINALEIARIAQDAGVKMLVLHGRTREQGFKGAAEYSVIKAVKENSLIPVVANGDIDSAAKALEVLHYTGADGVMIGRAAIGNPWIFSQIADALKGKEPQPMTKSQVIETIGEHLDLHFAFYDQEKGLKTIRKHLCAYFKRLDLCANHLKGLFALTDPIQLSHKVERVLEDELDEASCNTNPTEVFKESKHEKTSADQLLG